MTFAPGSLVRARGREWVVLPDSTEDLLVVRPIGAADDEVTGIYTPLEEVAPARFELPDVEKPGDYRSCRLLRDALRLGFRFSTGPFRSFAQIGVTPRPYQLVPLLMALRLDPVRLLIADDVGVGKTIESCLVARELLDRGEARRLAVLCPPHLAEQWQRDLARLIHVEAELVLASTAARLERRCTRVDQSIFDLNPFVVVSLDFIKGDRRREEFLRSCPELVIVDEAHTCAHDASSSSNRHQRHRLLRGLADDPSRHLILVTATPHSGNEEAFRSLLTLLRPEFANLPEDLTGKENEAQRRALARHFVQRRRGDLASYLGADTPFPTREEKDETYKLSPEYLKLLDRALDYARETVLDENGRQHRQRIRWWSALALLRSLVSSPAAAHATLTNRAADDATASPDEADAAGRAAVLDEETAETGDHGDTIPSADAGAALVEREESARRRLREMAKLADTLRGEKDEKLQSAIKLVKKLLADGFSPIVFCRFIPTAEYVAAELRAQLPKNVEVAAVTGTLPPADREDRVEQLGAAPRRVLVATDCLSEGINLQNHFDAVLHYDLAWNPTRHEQREGRVDRYGQPNKIVRVITYYGAGNPVDGIVLDVLLRKHKKIRSSLGISVPVPVNSDDLVEAIFEGLLLREKSASSAASAVQHFLKFPDLGTETVHREWEVRAEREKRSRTVFAQETIKVDDVKRELDATRAAIGVGTDVAAFFREALECHGARCKESATGILAVDLKETPRALRDALTTPAEQIVARFEPHGDDTSTYLPRTHPWVAGLAGYVLGAALDGRDDAMACRSGVIRTAAVTRRTTLLLLRLRFHVVTRRGSDERTTLAEEAQLLAFEGAPEQAEWLDSTRAEALLAATPDDNVSPDVARDFLRKVVTASAPLLTHVAAFAKEREQVLLQAHRRVREAAQLKHVQHRVEFVPPADWLGVYVLLPRAAAPGSAAR
jgi:superfamily II DNA or RNA helicase